MSGKHDPDEISYSERASLWLERPRAFRGAHRESPRDEVKGITLEFELQGGRIMKVWDYEIQSSTQSALMPNACAGFPSLTRRDETFLFPLALTPNVKYFFTGNTSGGTIVRIHHFDLNQTLRIRALRSYQLAVFLCSSALAVGCGGGGGAPAGAAFSIANPASSGLTQETRNSSWTGGAGNWFGPDDTCVSWDTCSGPGTNPGESGFTDNVFINAPGSVVTLNGGARIANLTLASGNSLTPIGTTYLEFDGSGFATLINDGSINLPDRSYISVFSTLSPLTLTISGGGTITLETQDNAIAGPATLINQETLQGQGSIGLGEMTLLNQGTINANASGGTLTVQPVFSGNLTNTGTLRASNGGIIRRAMVSSVLDLGSLGLLRYIETICKKRGLDVEKVNRHGLSAEITPLITR